MMLRLRTFGAVYLERNGTPLTGAHSQRRRLALLAYLAVAGKAGAARDKLLALLWPESDTASARHSLSQLLYALRHDLGAGIMIVDGESVRLEPDVLGSDVHAFDEAIRAERPEDAVRQYTGSFLDGFHVGDAPELDRWIEEERARRAGIAARAFDRLADAAERAGDWHRAVEWLRQRSALEPAHGGATLRLMRALAATGDREGALRAARAHEAHVRDHLGEEPDAAIGEFASQLRTVRQPTPRVVPVVPQPGTGPAHAAGATLPPGEAEAPARAARRRPTFRPRWLAAAAAVMVLGVAAVVGTSIGLSPSDDGTPGAVVVIGDLAGPDTVLALAVREALRAELVNTRGVLLTTDQSVRELRSLMRMPATSALRGGDLLTLAVRRGAHVAITGSVLPLGDGAQIMLELVDPTSGRSLRTFTERPASPAATLSSVERVARAIGSAVSGAAPDAAVRPLPAVTTASLPALKAFALARQLAARGMRLEAVAPAERAVTHDSTFVLAHYFLGDVLWFLDEQSHSEAHLTTAYALVATVPPREQLVIRARYEQLVRDRPDSALAYWNHLARESPGDASAFEGRSWALRALGRHEEAAASADSALSLDEGAIQPNLTNAMYSWLAVGDTAKAIAVAQRVVDRYPDAVGEMRFVAALSSHPAEALLWAGRATRPALRFWRQHHALVVMGDVRRARLELDSLRRENGAQALPNAMINQGLLELVARGDTAVAAAHARAALDWTRRRDLSPPAIGRLVERIAHLAARAGDEPTVTAAIAMVRERDRGRFLRTYDMTLRALDAALAYVRGDYQAAATLAESARQGVYFSRSISTLVQLEADARRRTGETAAADSLERLIDSHRVADGHFEAQAVLRALNRLAKRD